MTTPKNLNQMSSVQYRLDFYNMPNTTYFLQTALLPGIDVDTPQQPTPRRMLPVTPSHFTFDPLIITFIVDEDLTNYMEIYRWMMKMARNDNEVENKTDATMHILSGQMNNKIKVRFNGIFPVSLTELAFGSNDQDNITTVSTCTFNYSYFDFPGRCTIMGTDEADELDIDGSTPTI